MPRVYVSVSNTSHTYLEAMTLNSTKKVKARAQVYIIEFFFSATIYI